MYWAVKISVYFISDNHVEKNVFHLNFDGPVCWKIVSSGPWLELIQSLRGYLNVWLSLSVTGNFTTFQWILPVKANGYLLEALGENTVIKATEQLAQLKGTFRTKLVFWYAAVHGSTLWKSVIRFVVPVSPAAFNSEPSCHSCQWQKPHLRL